jgi:hypothetical protein
MCDGPDVRRARGNIAAFHSSVWYPIMTRRLLFAAIPLTALWACLLPTIAFAEGATTIASAPVVAFGQQEFGNLADGFITRHGPCETKQFTQWWSLSVVAGDQVTFDWEAQEADTGLSVFPVGTTDFNSAKESPVYSLGLSANKKNEGNFTATKSGGMPLNITASEPYCENAKPGPYDFTALVKGTLRIGVHNPEGGPISAPALSVLVEVKLGSVWRPIGTSTVTSGAAIVQYKLPRSMRNRSTAMRVVASGAEYVTETSPNQRVKTR